MRIGMDFGTTRVVVAAADRGNFPLVNFESPDGLVREWFPPVAAVKGEERVYGWEAVAAQADDEWTVVRSLKRWLRTAGPKTLVRVGSQEVAMRTLLAEMMTALRAQLIENSTLGAAADEPLEVMLGVPASANSNQRFLTEEAAQDAGFTVLGLVNEPSAAAIEFAHRNSAERKGRAGSGLVVYDLGGGTFDVSLVTLGETEHVVEATDGIAGLGGDDFDEILANLALEAAGEAGTLSAAERYNLLEECREKKESLNPNTRKVTVDLERVRAGWQPVTIAVDTYYERCRPLIEQTRDVVERLLAANADSTLDTLYVTGGASELPPVARILRETFGRKVRRSSYMRSASAIGMAIRAAAGEGLADRLNQNFGIWREADSGGTIVFDLIFPCGVRLPAANEAPMQVERIYKPAHNIGHFRYLECTRLDDDWQPTGEITNWDQVLFPFDPELQTRRELTDVPVRRLEHPDGLKIHEVYTCDASGRPRVKISVEPSGFAREFCLAQGG